MLICHNCLLQWTESMNTGTCHSWFETVITVLFKIMSNALQTKCQIKKHYITLLHLAGCFSEDVLQFHDFLHKSMEVIASRACWEARKEISQYPVIQYMSYNNRELWWFLKITKLTQLSFNWARKYFKKLTYNFYFGLYIHCHKHYMNQPFITSWTLFY